MSLFGMPEGEPCCCGSGCCPGVTLPDCITLELTSSCCEGDVATVVLTNDTASLCPGGVARGSTAADTFCGVTPTHVYAGALDAGWCAAAELGDGTVLVFCCVDPITNEPTWWIYFSDSDLSHTWYPASTAQFYQLELISCDPFLLTFGSTPTCPSSCVWTWEAACFVAGTLVRTPTGDVPIQLLTEGDQVIDIHGDIVTVDRIMAGDVDVLMELTDEHGIPTGVTPDHPFFALDLTSTIPAGKIVAGQRLPFDKTIASVKAFQGTFTVYNLTVSGSHTFTADGYAVHNKGQE